MTGHIITFPADRCRQPASVIQAAEQLAYRSASLKFSDSDGGGKLRCDHDEACM